MTYLQHTELVTSGFISEVASCKAEESNKGMTEKKHISVLGFSPSIHIENFEKCLSKLDYFKLFPKVGVKIKKKMYLKPPFQICLINITASFAVRVLQKKNEKNFQHSGAVAISFSLGSLEKIHPQEWLPPGVAGPVVGRNGF